MKTIRLFILLAISALAIYSCNDSDPIENNANTQKSIALRTAVNEIKKANNIDGRSAANPFCFDFVYPIALSLSNGTNVTVSGFNGLVELLANESANLYVDGIGFPFQVTMQGAVSTIHDEDEFIQLLINCGFSTWNDDLETTYCFDIVFPVSVTTPNGTFNINTVEEFNAYLNAPANGQAQINYPVSVHYNGQVIVINNIYEFYDMINNCDSCVCTQEYAPVCVHTPNGIMQYGNMCFAECAGYSQNDIVNCNPNNVCSIENLTVTVGNCNSDGSYALTINFAFSNPGSTHFTVQTSNGDVVGTYSLSELPRTINHYPNSGQSSDVLTINIPGGGCSATQQWAVPNCGTTTCESACPTNFDPVCVQTANGIVQYSNACFAICAGHTEAEFITCGIAPVNFGTALGTCFNISFPVQIMAQGQVITANDNGTVLQYWNPAQSSIPAFVYPVTIISGNTTHVIHNQAEFEIAVNNCN